MVSGPGFNELAQALAGAGCQTEAAECHATLTGLLCAGGSLPQDWMAQISGGGDSLDDCRAELEALRSGVTAALASDSLEFDLLLPDDDEPLEIRTDALGHWCQGFLYGLTLGGIEAGQALPGDVGEVVSDFSRLSEVRHEGEASEEDETSYTEICEFVRVGTQLVFEELSTRRERP